MNRGTLSVWVDAAPAAEADFNDWYTREHVPERVGIPGFLSGARYRALSGTPRYLAWYETESPEVLQSTAYLERLNNPTEWTRRIMPSFRDTVRSVFEVRAKLGQGLGGVAATVRLAGSAIEGGTAEWLEVEALPGLAGMNGIVGVQLWALGDPSAAETAETRLRGADATCAAAVLIEATGSAEAEAACGQWLSSDRLRQAGFEGDQKTGIYRLLYALRKS